MARTFSGEASKPFWDVAYAAELHESAVLCKFGSKAQEMESEIERLQAIVAGCHEAIGEDSASDSESLPDTIRHLVTDLRERVASLERLLAVVDKLSKDSDGNPLAPGMIRWTHDGDKVQIRSVYEPHLDSVHVGHDDWRANGAEEWEQIASELFGSEAEAAEAAKQAAGGE